MKVRRLLWLAVALIAATALAALAVVALAQPPSPACPTVAPQKLVSDRQGAASALVPDTPSYALLCRYNGFSEPGQHWAGFMLLGQRTFGGGAAGTLAAQFDALPKWQPYGDLGCPSDEAAEAVVYFGYPSGPADPVTVALQGCAGSANGRASRQGYPPSVGTVRGSAAFIRAHQGWIDGTVEQCGGPAPGRCTPVSGGVKVLAAGTTWNGTASLRHGAFAQRATPGRDLVEYARGWLTGNPTPLLRRWVTVTGGQTTRVRLRLAIRSPAHSDTAPSTCPGSAPATVDSKRPGARSKLVPGAPVSVLMCRYNGILEPTSAVAGYTLIGQQLLRGSSAATVAREYDALLGWPKNGGIGPECPAAFGTAGVAYFGYAAGPGDPVFTQFSGCYASTNGPFRRLGGPRAWKHDAHASPSWIQAHEATITGTAELCGGAIGPNGQQPGCHPQTGTVKVLTPAGEETGQATLSPTGGFSVLAAPGHDLVELSGGERSYVNARAGHTTNVALHLYAP